MNISEVGASDGSADGTNTQQEGRTVISEVLCYMKHHLNSCAPDNIRKMVLSFYSGEVILEAKKTLWKEFEHTDILKRYQERRNTNSRTQVDANVSDILEALADIDRSDKRDSIVFAAVNLNNLPSQAPEEINEVALLRRIENMEKQWDILNCGTAAEFGLVKDRIQELETWKDSAHSVDSSGNCGRKSSPTNRTNTSNERP